MANMTVEKAATTWDDAFTRWSKPFSDSEEAMADNAASIIRGALQNHPALSNKNVEVYATGSYHNNTNVRGESDIDIAAVCHDTFFYDLPAGQQAHNFGLSTPASYTFASFRKDIQDALEARFGSGMTPGDKAFNIHENTYRLEADVTPFFEYRKYESTLASPAYAEGVKSISDSGSPFVNWHRDHYDQGVKRNLATKRRFKRITRILKNVKIDLIENGTAAAQEVAAKIPSFLVECIVFNAPDSCFNQDASGYVADVRCVISDLWTRTKPEGDWNQMVEVNWRKWLLRGEQPWNRQVVQQFLLEAWRHLFDE
jgi:hypothetical protein